MTFLQTGAGKHHRLRKKKGPAEAFRQALREFGYIEGESVNNEYRYSEGVPAAGAHRFSTLGFGRMIERAAQSLSLFGNSEKHCTAIGNRLYHPQFGYGRREIACDRRGL